MSRRAALLGACLAGLLAGGAIPARADAALQPYQMVRSLQLVQDRIADGDHAAVPMQRKLLEMIDARLLHASSEELAQERNLRAVLVYAMSGGNPKTMEATLVKLKLENTDKALSLGVVNYLRGKPAAAQSALAATDPVALPPELGAFVALIKGSVVADADPAAAIALLDQARLLGPGTLVEEAALRRSVSLATTLADPTRFLRLSSLYARRYLRSPYASQFADAFVAGVVTLNGRLVLDAVDEITSWMTGEQRQVIYLRIARRAAIDGLKPLAEFASSKAREGTGADDPRALLYSMLGTVASETMEEARLKLARIDRSGLSRSDLDLLDAVAAVAGGLTAVPPPLDGASTQTSLLDPAPSAEHPSPEAASVAAGRSAAEPEPTAQAQAHAGHPDAAPKQAARAAHEIPRDAAAGMAAPKQSDSVIPSPAPAAGPPGAGPQAVPVAAAADPADEIMKVARTKMEEVDKLLLESAQ